MNRKSNYSLLKRSGQASGQRRKAERREIHGMWEKFVDVPNTDVVSRTYSFHRLTIWRIASTAWI